MPVSSFVDLLSAQGASQHAVIAIESRAATGRPRHGYTPVPCDGSRHDLRGWRGLHHRRNAGRCRAAEKKCPYDAVSEIQGLLAWKSAERKAGNRAQYCRLLWASSKSRARSEGVIDGFDIDTDMAIAIDENVDADDECIPESQWRREAPGRCCILLWPHMHPADQIEQD